MFIGGYGKKTFFVDFFAGAIHIGIRLCIDCIED